MENILDELIKEDQAPPQGSPEWHVWRKKGIGSSEAAILMGLSRYKNVHQLWLEKTDQVEPEFVDNFLTRRGHRLEPHARRAYTKFSKIEVEDRLFIHPKFKFIRASLDGWSDEFELILEIKCPNRTNHYRAVAENYIKPEYYSQMQHQYLASGAKYADYWSFDGLSGHRIPVLPDLWFMGELLERELLFWECVEEMKAPKQEDFISVG